MAILRYSIEKANGIEIPSDGNAIIIDTCTLLRSILCGTGDLHPLSPGDELDITPSGCTDALYALKVNNPNLAVVTRTPARLCSTIGFVAGELCMEDELAIEEHSVGPSAPIFPFAIGEPGNNYVTVVGAVIWAAPSSVSVTQQQSLNRMRRM